MQNNMFFWIRSAQLNNSRYRINLASQCALSMKLFRTAPPTVDVYRTDVCVCCCCTTFLWFCIVQNCRRSYNVTTTVGYLVLVLPVSLRYCIGLHKHAQPLLTYSKVLVQDNFHV